MKEISDELYNKLKYLGIVDSDTRSYNVGKSDYSKHIIQPWSIWIDYNLNAFDADIVKRVLRTKEGEDRITDYEKIIHICQERIRQLSANVPTTIKQEQRTRKIQRGDIFECVEDVVMHDNDEIAYAKGYIYHSHCDGCITDEQGDEQHYWDCGLNVDECTDKWEDYFKRI